MNEFQILNAEGEAISINTLDQEAAKFWGKPLDSKSYASPAKQREGEGEYQFMSREMSANWFDQLGYAIANQGNYTSGWQNVALYMLDCSNYLLEEDKDTVKLCTFNVTAFDGVPLATADLSKYLAMGLIVKLEYAKPYVDLMNHWQAKGYTPKQIKKS